ncbi:Nicotine blue oxidoreductase [Tepidimonas aquatica]|uniref:Nicotine blue oxidoreductase n=1 Tax=Tepidimonas aquatica TaxID=247482 RepID=A0A554WC99_9BURK|nr:Nicotine blue oxidoreductase [Tepidimonas aquatica]
MGCILKQGGGLYSRLRLGAVLLAAGEGRRMGGVAKPLIRLQGVPLIRRHLIALSGAGVDEVVVVTGHAHAAVQNQVQEFPVTVIHNPAYRQGQQTSVRAGLAALNPALDAVLVVLVDQPLIGAQDLTELIAAYKKGGRRDSPQVLLPIVNGQRGNPIVLNQLALASILNSEANLACRHFVESHPELVQLYKTDNTRFITDLDTLDDVQALTRRMGWSIELPEPLAP